MSLDQLYLSHRKLMDLTHMGRIEKSSEICNQMSKIVRLDLNKWRFQFQNSLVREMVIKFSDWLLRLINHIDDTMPDLVYILPDNFISIPFEAYRLLKRESSFIVQTGIPLS